LIRHMLKLVWKRKRANALLILEIFASFLVLFAVARGVAATIIRWRMPLGFDYHNVWQARLSFPPKAAMSNEQAPQRRAAVQAMLREIGTLGPVESAAASNMPPYGGGGWTSSITHNGRRIDTERDFATDDFAKVMKLPILAGRWFSAEDDASGERVVVIDADLAREAFGNVAAAVGQRIETGKDQMSRVVGVIAPYRKDGELSQPKTYMLFHRALQSIPVGPVGGHAWGIDRLDDAIPRELVIRVRPGTNAAFEETLIKRLHAVAPDYDVRIRHMEQVRDLKNRLYLTPAVALSVIAGFLIFMVALGLSGVLWQTVTRRTREIGLRRAVGATASSVHRQILGEVALLATIAVAAGVILIAQLPFIGGPALTPGSFAAGLATALATIYGITLLCGLYPSWLAGRVQPAQALHYE
jgi:putative ABC transport system permease protein